MGVGEAAAVDEAATDAAATAEAVVEIGADVVTETAIAGSTDVALDLGSDVSVVEPFSAAFGAGEGAEWLVAGLSAADTESTTITELDDQATSELRMVALTTQAFTRRNQPFWTFSTRG